jgi:hypothetical protein
MQCSPRGRARLQRSRTYQCTPAHTRSIHRSPVPFGACRLCASSSTLCHLQRWTTVAQLANCGTDTSPARLSTATPCRSPIVVVPRIQNALRGYHCSGLNEGLTTFDARNQFFEMEPYTRNSLCLALMCSSSISLVANSCFYAINDPAHTPCSRARRSSGNSRLAQARHGVSHAWIVASRCRFAR